jgi:hypothetical protein
MQPFSLPERRRVAFTALAFATHENTAYCILAHKAARKSMANWAIFLT